MTRFILLAVLLFCALIVPVNAQLIEKIEIEGNQKVSRDTIQFYMKSRPGGAYNRERLQEDFRALWDTGFFEHIRFSSKDGGEGKIVYVSVRENPLIASVTYKTGKKVKESDIVDKLKEQNITIQPFSYFNPSRMRRIESTVLALFQDKGYNDAEVRVIENRVNDQVELTIEADPGPKTRIGRVIFPGLDSQVRAGRLRRGMKNNQVHNILSTIAGKDVYNREKIQEDLEEVRLRLQEQGFLEARVGQPEISLINRKNAFGTAQKMMQLSIPVEPGPRYTMNELSIEGNQIVKTEFLKSFVKIEKGKVYDIRKRNKAIEEMQKFYGSLGYFYCQIAPRENLDPVKQTADLTLNIQENEVVYLGKLEFIGNTFTKDHVLRREWFLREGVRLNSNALEHSITRMKQLGLVTIDKMPEIKPDPQDPQKLNIKVEVKELNRQMINFNVGYSGYDGLFVALGYSTQNFMGMGESLTLNLQTGTRSKNYQLAFNEPYLFNLPASLGFDLFKSTFRIPYMYTRDGEGLNLMTAFRFWRYWGFNLTYSLERVAIDDINEEYIKYDPMAYLYYLEGKRIISGIAPTIYYSTVDSPVFPSRGVKYLLNYRYTGGILGGDVFMHKYKFEFVKFQPLWKRHVLGLHLVYQGISAFGGRQVPFYEKYFLGGERSIRGFDIYQIPPRTEDSFYGGDWAAYMNIEYQIPVSEQIAFVLFYDIGNAYNAGDRLNLRNMYSSTGLELKVFVPMLNVPFRLIFAYNPRKIFEEESHFQFRFAVGPSFY